MMKKVIFTLSLAGLCTSAAWAQRLDPCSTDQMHQKQVEAHPELLEMEANLNKAIAEKLARNEMAAFAKTTDDDGTTVYHIPLVFHVIHDFGAEYVTDDTIRSCVKRMNSLYNKTNADTIDVVAPFKGFIHNSSTRYIGNARIMWHLATKDPNGNPTTGITRRRTYMTNSGSDFAKYDQWPNENYMNIWLINSMSASNKKAAAYAYKPPTASLIPYYDGPIGVASAINEYDFTYSHELGHELNLDHVWGGTNDPEVACGDDEVDDTPITKGHAPAPPSSACSPARIYDTTCLYKRNIPIAKTRPDSFRRADTGVLLLFTDNSTTKGITFKNRTASRIDSLSFYPTDTVGSTYKIGVSRNGVLFDSVTVVTTVRNAEQRIACNFKVPAADTSVNFKMAFLVNPGALRDTLHPSVRFSTGINGSIDLRTVQTDNFYNFFYSWKITYGNFQIYPNDSLVDYPDTTNSQNVMDYTYCSKMFTTGQVERMRTALTLTGPSSANRGNLITTENLKKTGVYDASGNVITTTPELKPEAEVLVYRGRTGNIYSTDRLYFMCAESAANYNFIFINKSWQAPTTSVNWILSNSPVFAPSGSDSAIAKFANTGWATATLVATNAQGSDTATERVFVADPATMDPVGYFQEFNDKAEIDSKWPMFNYYNNQYKWELSDRGYYDNTSMRYKSYDVRTFPATLVGDPSGDYDDFFTPAFDLSKLGTNGNLNFMYAGAYATNDYSLMKDVLEIAYSTNCGGAWTTLSTMANEELQTVGSVPMGMEYLSVYKDWKPKSINLKTGTADIRNTRVFFRFRYKPSSRMIGGAMYASGNNFYIDRIHISNNPLSVNEMILVDKQATLAPNPTNSNAFVLFGKPNANVHISVTDVTGKLIYTVSTAIDKNNARVEIPASALGVKGFYMVHITGDDNLNQTEKLVVY